MSMHHDPDLEDVLQDDELLRIAGLLRATRRAEPPLDEAFRSELRRTLMQQAWGKHEARTPWWQRLGAPPSMAWAGAAAGIVLIASVVVFMASQPPALSDVVITSPIADAHSVQLQQPILVKFNQPMDHKSTEAAVAITPATYVDFSWQQNTLAVQPTSGNLAPNTQYQVTIGAGAKTQSGQSLPAAKTITFVTQPAKTPPSPKPTLGPTPTSLLSGEHRLATLPSGTQYAPQWSPDSTTVYVIGAGGALESVTAGTGDTKVVVADGVSFPAIAPAGDRLAYVRGGKIEVLTIAGATTTDIAPAPDLTTLSWAADQLLWGTNAGVFKAGPDGPVQVAAIPQDAGVVSIAPDGGHAVFQEGHSLSLLDVASSKSVPLGPVGSAFLGWSPDGSRLIYQGADANVIADVQGETVATIPAGDPSWSAQNEILLGSDTNLYAVRPDGFGLTKLQSGSYDLPAWAPNGSAFSFVRGNALWAATATPLPVEPSYLDQAGAVVSSFMAARLALQPEQARTYLDDNGKQAYSSSGLPLTINGDAKFSRFYVLAQEMTGSRPEIATFVVRLVLSKGGLDVSDFEETLTLQRDQATHPFLVDQASASAARDLGKGAEVVSVDMAAGSVKVVFDSDLVSDTVADGVVFLDGSGKRVGGASTYTNRTVVITGLDLTPGASYKLVVLPSVQDVSGRGVPAEYDLNLLGPTSAGPSGGQGSVDNPQPSASPSPIVTPPASPSPSPVS